MPVVPKDVRLPLMVSKSEADTIDEWWHRNKLRSRAEAVRALIALGLGAGAQDQNALDPSPGPETPLHAASLMNPERPYPRKELSAIPIEATEQLNVKITARLRKNITWMAQICGEKDREFVSRVLHEHIDRAVRLQNAKPVF